MSRSIAALEQSLGVQLFNRTTRQVALSTASASLLHRVAAPLGSLRDAVEGLPEREEDPSGELRITAPPDMGATFLPELVAGFSARYPSVQVDVRLSPRPVDLVAEGFDAALRVGPRKLPDSSLIARHLSAVETQVFASPNYLERRGVPHTTNDAADHDWVLFRGAPPPAPLRSLSRATCRAAP